MDLYCIVHDTDGGYSNRSQVFCGTINNVHRFEGNPSKAKPKIWMNHDSAKKRWEQIRSNPDSNIGYIQPSEIYLKSMNVGSGLLHY